MNTWDNKSLLVLSVLGLYVVFLIVLAFFSAKKVTNSREFLFGSGFGVALSLFGVAASLFSSFTLQGMPDFFRNHGITAWVFLGITDVCLAAVLLYFGLKMRHFAKKIGTQKHHAPKSLTEWLKQSDIPRWAVLFFVVATTLFMIPYVTIGIKGSAMLMQAAAPLGDSQLSWSVVIVALMLFTLLMGGLHAVSVTDVVQGVILMFAVWMIALFAIKGAGGVGELFSAVADTNPALLSAPGPVGLLNVQFLLVSFISILTIPFVQPQMATRIFVAKDDKTFIRSAMGLSVFAILVILPTVFIGMRGATLGVGGTAAEFILHLIASDAPLFFFALFIIGAWAADMSTVDSQLLAIGTEWRSAMLKGDIQNETSAPLAVKIGGIFVALVALVLAQTSFSSLVLFAVSSFVGTSLLLPIVVAATVACPKKRLSLIIVSVVAVVVFIPKLFGLMPEQLGGIKLELYLYAIIGAVMLWACQKWA